MPTGPDHGAVHARVALLGVLVGDDVLEGVAGALAVVIVALLALLIWRWGGDDRDEPPRE
jgi:hypothetical protein